MEKKELDPEQLEKVTGGIEKRKYDADPLFDRPEDAIKTNGSDARMEEADVPVPVLIPDPNPEKPRRIT